MSGLRCSDVLINNVSFKDKKLNITSFLRKHKRKHVELSKCMKFFTHKTFMFQENIISNYFKPIIEQIVSF